MVYPKPYLWEENKALSFFEIYRKICGHYSVNPFISREMIALIFFEETGFSNVRQNRGTGPAVGFGQMEIYNHDKIPFFEWLGFNSNRWDRKSPLRLITPEQITNDNDLSVKITCKYFDWLLGVKGKSTMGALEAQTGGGANRTIIPCWLNAERELKSVIRSGDRMKLIRALNMARSGGPHPNPIKYEWYQAYWEFTVPNNPQVWRIAA